MSETIGERIITLANDWRLLDTNAPGFGRRSATIWEALLEEGDKANAHEAIARAALARHKAAERSHRWRSLYRLSARNKRPDRPGRHIRIGAKLIEAMNVADNYYDSEQAACEIHGGKL